MQQVARTIDADCAEVVHKSNQNELTMWTGYDWFVGVSKMIVYCTQNTFGNGIGVVETGLVTGHRHIDRLPRDNEGFPIKPGGFLAQFRKGSGKEFSEPDGNPAGSTQVEVAAINIGVVAIKLQSPRFIMR